jgi:hypothetical protein
MTLACIKLAGESQFNCGYVRERLLKKEKKKQ